MKYVLLGKIVNTHGIKGEIRILSDFPYKDKVFNKISNVYIGKEKIREEIVSYRQHKNYDMICLKGINNINDVLKYKGMYIFINKEELKLDKNEYLDEDIVNLDVVCNNKKIAVVKKVVRYDKNNLLLCKNMEKEFYIPYNFDIIKKIDLDDKIIEIEDIKGLIV